MEKKFELTSDCSELKSFRENLNGLFLEWGLKGPSCSSMLLAVQEAVTNAIRHAYKGEKGRIEVSVQDLGNQVKVSIRDYGRKFDITQVEDPDLPKEEPGGLGIYFIKQSVDEVQYDSACTEGNLLHLVKYKK